MCTPIGKGLSPAGGAVAPPLRVSTTAATLRPRWGYVCPFCVLACIPPLCTPHNSYYAVSGVAYMYWCARFGHVNRLALSTTPNRPKTGMRPNRFRGSVRVCFLEGKVPYASCPLISCQDSRCKVPAARGRCVAPSSGVLHTARIHQGGRCRCLRVLVGVIRVPGAWFKEIRCGVPRVRLW